MLPEKKRSKIKSSSRPGVAILGQTKSPKAEGGKKGKMTVHVIGGRHVSCFVEKRKWAVSCRETIRMSTDTLFLTKTSVMLLAPDEETLEIAIRSWP